MVSIHAPTKGATNASKSDRTSSLFQSTLLRKERHSDTYAGYAVAYVSIHAPTKGATFSMPCATSVDEFQSTLLRKERLCSCTCVSDREWFQSTLLRKERHFQPPIPCIIQSFNPRSYERSDVGYRLNVRGGTGFNPRSYERSDFASALNSSFTFSVSIHAPTKGATLYHGYATCRHAVSIHAPTKGATTALPVLSHQFLCFNPRSYERSDLGLFAAYRMRPCFNPRSYERSDGSIPHTRA